MKLRLTLEVDYNPNGTGVDELKQILEGIVKNAFNEGGLTWVTDAEVDNYEYKVEEIKESKLTKKKITLCDGKYMLVHNEKTGGLYAYRHGLTWRSCIGDGFILSLFQKIEELGGLDS